MATPDLMRQPSRTGLVERAITRILMRPAHVTGISRLSDKFRLLDFQGEALKHVSWRPGDKVQVKLDRGLNTRTYTPTMWDTVAGTTQFLAYCHDGGPGSIWARHATVGDERQFFGPRNSLDLDDITEPATLFGDETSFALALALDRHQRGAERRYVFEVNDRDKSLSVLATLGLGEAVDIERQPDNSHLHQVGAIALSLAQPSTIFVLSGKAPSIQHVSRSLKASGIAMGRLRTKAYWTPGKVGLD